jgi:hypothetical protein
LANACADVPHASIPTTHPLEKADCFVIAIGEQALMLQLPSVKVKKTRFVRSESREPLGQNLFNDLKWHSSIAYAILPRRQENGMGTQSGCIAHSWHLLLWRTWRI